MAGKTLTKEQTKVINSLSMVLPDEDPVSALRGEYGFIIYQLMELGILKQRWDFDWIVMKEYGYEEYIPE